MQGGLTYQTVKMHMSTCFTKSTNPTSAIEITLIGYNNVQFHLELIISCVMATCCLCHSQLWSPHPVFWGKVEDEALEHYIGWNSGNWDLP